MKKFYCFTTGQRVPKWIIDYVSDNREAEIKNRKGKITFVCSCIGIRENAKHLTLMKTKSNKTAEQTQTYISIENMDDARVGGIGKGSGISIFGNAFQHLIGKDKKYIHSIVNGKEILQEVIANESPKV